MLDDSKRLMVGISDIAYADNGNTYVNNIRSFLGWEASVEMAHVNTVSYTHLCEEWVDEVLIPPCAESEYPYEMADIFLEMGIACLLYTSRCV